MSVDFIRAFFMSERFVMSLQGGVGEFVKNQELANNAALNAGRARLLCVEALGLRPEPMRGVWNNASAKDRRFICKILNIVDEQYAHDDAVRVGAGAWAKSWDELSGASRTMIAECFMRLRGWVNKLDAVREGGVHHD